jgi:hypothetical protein
MRKIAIMLAAALACAVAVGADSVFFRVVSTQQTSITSISSDRVITWSNQIPNSVGHLEWTPSPDGIWITNDLPGPVQSTGHVSQAIFDEVFVTGSPSTVISPSISNALSSVMEFDVNRDGRIEIQFSYQTIAPDGEDGGAEQFTAFNRDPCVLILEPQMAGTILGPPSSNTTEFADPLGGLMLVSRSVDPPSGPWTGGRWKSVTNAYLPFRFPISGRHHYGWINIELGTNVPFRFISCAYETVPQKGIIAGATR